MQRLRFHPLWRPWPLARRTAGWQRSVLLALLGWSLLVAGELGQLHRYAHHPAEGPHSLATAAVRDENDYQRVLLEEPALILDAEGVNPRRVTAKSGVYSEDRRVLNLDGGVRMSGADTSFDTLSSIFNTATGELEGEGPISGSSSLGEITAKSYGVYDKGERLVFKGGVRGRIDSK